MFSLKSFVAVAMVINSVSGEEAKFSDRLIVELKKGEDLPVGFDLSRAYPNELKSPDLAKRFGLDRFYVIKTKGDVDRIRIQQALGQSRKFVRIEREEKFDVVPTWTEYRGPVGTGVLDHIPSDPDFPSQWSLHNTGQIVAGSPATVGIDINATGAWDFSTGTGTSRVALIDTGLYPHAEYADRILSGWNTYANAPAPTSDDCIHGTLSAGLLASAGNNPWNTIFGVIGMAGVNFRTQLVPIRVTFGCSGSEITFANAFVWAADERVDLIYTGLRLLSPSSYLEAAINYVNAHQVPIVATASNEGMTTLPYPAAYESVIAVGGINQHGQPWTSSSFGTSNAGPNLWVVAPAEQIYTTFAPWAFNIYPYISWHGTTAAAAMTAGVVSLMIELNSRLRPTDIKRILQRSARRLQPSWTPELGYGLLDAKEALRLSQSCLADVDLSLSLNANDYVTFSNLYSAAHPWADMDGNGHLNSNDFILYSNAYAGGCWPNR